MDSFDVNSAIIEAKSASVRIAEKLCAGTERTELDLRFNPDDPEGSNSLDEEFIRSLDNNEHLEKKFLDYYNNEVVTS